MPEPSVTIKKAKNGWVVSCWGKGKEITYVYDSLDEALKEIKGIVSVAEEENKEEGPKVETESGED